MARILFLTQVLPYPLYGGQKIRAYYILKYLTQKHEVTLVSFVREDDKPAYIAHLQQLCQKVYAIKMERSRLKDGQSLFESVLSGTPIVIARDRIPAMELTLERLVKEAPFDAIHADQTSMAYYGMVAKRLHPSHKKPVTILDQHNALYLVVQRQSHFERSNLMRTVWRREARLLAEYEASLLRQFDTILTVTTEDKEALLQLLPDDESEHREKNIVVIPICVDPARQKMIQPVDRGSRILHLGTMFWPPNIEGVLWFANQVLPLILREIPGAKFIIAGKNPPLAIQDLAEDTSPFHGNIEVTGFIPDPMDLLAESQVFVVPLLAGGGMRVKILDAWVWGLPIVSTTIGAEGIMKKPGENILIADAPQEFAAAVVKILKDRLLAYKLREKGRASVEMYYDWQKVYQCLDGVYGLFQSIPA
jgi:glycosyltransferase involved in cell wall biosynthesis